MAAVAVASSPAHHYIRTFTSPSTWSRNAPTPAYSAPQQHHHHQQQPLKSAASPPGGRRRAYAFRVASPQPQAPRSTGGGYKFDPFADEPTTPTLQTLASLSVPPPAPRLAPASLPGRKPYNHQLAQQAKRGVPPGYSAKRLPAGVEPLPLPLIGGGNNDMWKGFSPKPIPKARGGFTYEVVEYDDYDVPPPSLSPPPPYTATSPTTTTLLNSPYTPRRSVSPPSRPASPALNPRSPAFTPSSARRAPAPAYSAPPTPAARPQRLTRTPSPPASPAPAPSFSSTRQALQNDRDAKSRLVAGILLNRVHVPKVRRRPLVPGLKRPYVPSGLRNEVIIVEA
ncbi:hypothetical protein BKA70DRAFT_1285694 [Coprinopsis sp. MPI-PUGE-AT-0042]|nr:hypothetical protein BKA70DRAFT_1285694 [Coprinopsis sp. MPI-PUGE-AT-0042]